jgi:hypothetical protein
VGCPVATDQNPSDGIVGGGRSIGGRSTGGNGGRSIGGRSTGGGGGGGGGSIGGGGGGGSIGGGGGSIGGGGGGGSIVVGGVGSIVVGGGPTVVGGDGGRVVGGEDGARVGGDTSSGSLFPVGEPPDERVTGTLFARLALVSGGLSDGSDPLDVGGGPGASAEVLGDDDDGGRSRLPAKPV